MIKVKSLVDNVVKEVSEKEAFELGSTGEYAVEKKEFVAETDRGERRRITPKDFAEAKELGYRVVSQDELKREDDLKVAGEKPVQAALLGLARPLTFGLSDQILTKSGLYEEQEIKDIRDANPVASGGAEIAGYVAPAILSGGTSAIANVAGKSLPGMLARVSAGVGKKAADTAVKKFGKTLGSNPVVQKAFETAINVGVAGGLEGAVVGAADLVSEDALGDAEFNAQNLVAKMGTGALLGSAVGGILGGSASLIGSGLKETKSGIAQMLGVSKKDLVKQIKADTAINQGVKALDEAFPMARNVEAEKIAEELGVKATPAQLSDNVLVQGLESSLYQAPSLRGGSVRNIVDEAIDSQTAKLTEIIKPETLLNSREAGDQIAANLVAEMGEKIGTARVMYNKIDEVAGELPINERIKKLAINRFTKTKSARFGDSPEVKEIIQKVENVFTFDDARHVKKLLQSRAATLRSGQTPNYDLADVYTDAAETMKRMTISAILKEMPGGLVAKKSYVEALKKADRIYANAYKMYKPLAEEMGIRSKNINAIIEDIAYLGEKEPEKIFDKLFKNAKKSTIDFFAEKFPTTYDKLARAKLDEFFKIATKEGEFQPKAFFTAISEDEKKRPGITKFMFGDKYDVFEKLKKLNKTLPKKMGPSGTPQGIDYQNLLNLSMQVRDEGRFQAYKAMSSGKKNFFTRNIPIFNEISSAGNETAKRIDDSIRMFTSQTIRPLISQGSLQIGRLSTREYNDNKEKMQEIQQDPEAVMENFVLRNQELFESAPKVAMEAEQTIRRAVQLLAEKFPKQKESVLDGTREPSRNEVTKFAAYARAIDNPMTVFDDLSKGYVSPDGFEVLKKVYPKILAQFKETLIDRASSLKKLSQKQKDELTRALGIKISPSYSNQGFAILQSGSSQQIKEEVKQVSRVPSGAAKNIKASNRQQSGIDRTLFRD